jgi:hypothetical protein
MKISTQSFPRCSLEFTCVNVKNELLWEGPCQKLFIDLQRIHYNNVPGLKGRVSIQFGPKKEDTHMFTYDENHPLSLKILREFVNDGNPFAGKR